MKIFLKNKFLKIASLLVVVFLITTCVIGTTFAKYTTGASGSDSARIAKWGIEVSASGSLFGKNYGSSHTIVASDDTGITVAAGGDYKVVAPGTKNDTGFQVKISGTPEVDYEMKATSADVEDISLSAGTYGMMVKKYGLTVEDDVTSYYTLDSGVYTKCASTDKWTSGTDYYELKDAIVLEGTYYPIQWYLNGAKYDTLEKALTEITTKTNVTKAAVVDSADAEYTLTWSWAYEQTDKENTLDTILGNLAAGKTNIVKKQSAAVGMVGTVKYESIIEKNIDCYNLEVGFKYNITIEQVD